MGFQIAKGIFPFLVLIILQAIQPVSQKCNNFSVTIIVFPLDSILRQWEAAGLRMNIAAYQQGKQGWMGKILRDYSSRRARILIYTKAMVNATVCRLLPFS